jgi:hypothetical protein
MDKLDTFTKILLFSAVMIAIFATLYIAKFDILKEINYYNKINNFNCSQKIFLIKEISFTKKIKGQNYPYYVLEYNNNIYYYKINNIPKNTPNNIDLYFFEYDNWIYDQELLKEKCEK